MYMLQDSTSPAHSDFREAWNDSGVGSYWRHKDHYVSESLVLPSTAILAKEQTINAWYYYKGERQMPTDYFKTSLHDSIFGPSFSHFLRSSSVSYINFHQIF
jgi:hypothetical protein